MYADVCLCTTLKLVKLCQTAQESYVLTNKVLSITESCMTFVSVTGKRLRQDIYSGYFPDINGFTIQIQSHVNSIRPDVADGVGMCT